MDDIEDIIQTDDYLLSSGRMRNTVMPRVRRRNKIHNTDLADQLANGISEANCTTSETCCNTSLNPDASSCDSTHCCQNSKNTPTDNTSDQSCIKEGTEVRADSSSDCCSSSKKSSENNSCRSQLSSPEDSSIGVCNGVSSSSSASNEETCDAVPGSRKHAQSNIPGLAQIHVRTWGCAHNSSDSEYMAGQLAAYGYDIVENKEEADLWLLNSCTVKSPAEHHLRNEINAAHTLGKKVVVAGCVSQGARWSKFLAGLSIVGVQQIDRVVEVVEETLRGNSVRLLGAKKVGSKRLGGASLQLPKIRRNPLIEIISINTGCLNQCTYCKTKHARGNLASYPIDELVQRAVQSFSEGVVEIWLTSEDTGAYGIDIGVTLPELLYKLVEVIPPGCKLRLGMTNPPYILDHLKEMSEILLHPRVYRFLHVPVQSGSDEVLSDMKREYTREQFCTVVDTLRQSVPGITIATDIICGYPTETEENFEETMSLCRKYRFPSLFINQYFPRPGTPAAKLPLIPANKVKLRTKELSKFFMSYEPYTHKLGERQMVLVTQESHDKNYWVGHNDYYDQVLVPKVSEYMGKTLLVEITETGKHFLKCRVLDGEQPQSPALAKPLPQGAVSGAAVRVAPKLSEAAVKVAAAEQTPSKVDLVRQEKYIIASFVVIISALIMRMLWLGWRLMTV